MFLSKFIFFVLMSYVDVRFQVIMKIQIMVLWVMYTITSLHGVITQKTTT